MAQSDEGDVDVSEQLNATADAETFVGKSYQEAEAALGTPTTEESFTMSTGLQEFRIELRNIFDPSETPEIREVTWRRSADENLTLWFADKDGTSTAVHYMVWHPDSEF